MIDLDLRSFASQCVCVCECVDTTCMNITNQSIAVLDTYTYYKRKTRSYRLM